MFLALIHLLLDGTTRFFDYLQKTSNKHSTSRIQKLARKDSHAAVKERKRLRRRRLVIKAVYHLLVLSIAGFAGLFFVFTAFYGQYIGRWNGLTALLLIIAGVPFLIIAAGSIKALGEKGLSNISTVETFDIIGSGVPYALYLRAFKADDRKSVFDELRLAKMLYSQGVLMVGVGLPEEVDSPRGAVRIYISDDRWKEEVHLLLECASYVFLRVCNTESCLWEVEQVLASEKNLYIIVDNMKEYDIVHTRFPALPTIPEFHPDEYVIYLRVSPSEWEDVTPGKQDSHNDAAYYQAYITIILNNHPILEDCATEEQFEQSIEGLFTHINADKDHASNIRVALRIMDLLELYCTKEDLDGRVSGNTRRYLKMYDIFSPLPAGLQVRKKELEKRFNSVP